MTALTTAAVLRWGLLPGEAALREAIRHAAGSDAVELARLVSDAGTWRGLVPATALLLALSSYARRRWWLWAAVLVLAPVLGDGWQELVGRPRPHGSAPGFPSGHAVAVATYAVLVCYLVGRSRLRLPWRAAIGTASLLAMCLVGLARIVRGSHWPADVLVGFALGCAAASAAACWDRSRASAPP